MGQSFLQDLENHWKLLSALGLYTLFLIRFAFSFGTKSKSMVTEEKLEKFCGDKMESCLQNILPTIEQYKKDEFVVHDLGSTIAALRKEIGESHQSRLKIDKKTELIWRHTIKLRSQAANTQIILGYMVDKIWKERDPDFKKLVDDIFTKDREEVIEE